MIRCNALRKAAGMALAISALLYAAPASAQVTPVFARIKWVQVDDGTAALPSLAFTFNVNTGFYRIGLNNIGLSTNGTLRVDWNASRVKLASGYNLFVGANQLTTSDLLDATKLSGLVPGANGGTANGFFAVSGPATSLKTFTFPNASATVLTDQITPTSTRYIKGNGSAWITSTGAASGTGGCTNQFARTLNSDAAPTCATVASTDVDSSIVTLAGTDALTGRKDFTQYTEKKTAPSISSNVLTINLQSGTFFAVSMNANVTTLTLSNPPASGTAGSAVLVLTQDGTGGRTVTWPAAVKWPAGTAPTLSAANKTDIVTLVTFDAGTTYYGFISGQNY